ncbi:unnamed protein product [Orchesella dallaii]|uniref:RecF/RecN/SMC N-terminal domain-containing protein n=1 Tax=Orchesella dallaii TaxID=48710 RepID=A0ABP1Q4K1_9HEXA
MREEARISRRSTRNVQAQVKPSYSETRKRKQARPQHYEDSGEIVEPSSSTDHQVTASFPSHETGTDRDINKRRKLAEQTGEEILEQGMSAKFPQKRMLRSQYDELETKKQNTGSTEPSSSTEDLPPVPVPPHHPPVPVPPHHPQLPFGAPFHDDDDELSYNYNLDFWSVDVDGIVNDTFLGAPPNVPDEDSLVSPRERALHTPTAEMSPIHNAEDGDGRPHTPTIRPATPDFTASPMTPAGIPSSSLETSSIVGASNAAGYGPPPTPLCPPRRYVRDGNLISTKMVNFMTHKEKTANWNPNVHIVVGQNGSGKSACINALLLVFGDRASNTQRASSVKSLIKRGHMHGEIEVRVTNYYGTLDKHRYGEEIVISRKIKYSGSSVYMISAPNKTKRKLTQTELSYITHALQIDPNNPTQFLKQERPGESGKTGTGGDCNHTRFKKFLASTQLTTKKYMVDQARENLEAARGLITDKEDMQRFVALQTQELQKQCSVIKKMEESKDLLQELENEQVWSEVRVREDEQNQIKSRKQDIYSELKSIETESKGFDAEMEKFKLLEKANIAEIEKVQRLLNTKVKEKDRMKETLKDATKMLQRAKNDHDINVKSIQKYTKEIAEFEARLNEDKRSFEDQNEQHRREIEVCEEQIRLKKESLPKWERRDKILSEIDEFKAREKQGEKEIAKLKALLMETNKELNKQGESYGKLMNDLQKKIEQAVWTIRPVGPLASFIQIPDAKYAPIIERIIAPCLLSFFVQTQDDCNRLRDMIDEVYSEANKANQNKKYVKSPNVALLPNLDMNEYARRLNYTKRSLSRFRTVLSMLRISDPVAEVGIIEITGCERVLLFDSNQSAATVMKNKEVVPKEVNMAYTLEWFKATARPRYQFMVFQEPRYKTDIIPMAGVEAAVHIKEEITREREVVNTCKRSCLTLEMSLSKHDREVQDINKEIMRLTNKVNAAKNAIKLPEQNDEDIANDIKMLIEMREKQERDIQVNSHEMETAKSAIKKIMEEKEEIMKEIGQMMEKRHELESQRSHSTGSYPKIQKEIDKTNVRKELLTKQFNQLSLEDTKIDNDLKKKLAVAETTGKRPKDLNRDPKVIQLEMDNLETYLKENCDKLKQKTRVATEYKNSKQLLNQITTELNCIKFLCERLDPYIKVGEDCYEKMKEVLGRQLKCNFQELVESHKLTGGIQIDWDQELLIYWVCPDKASEERANRNYQMVNGEMKIVNKQGISDYHGSLSGGEKSKALVFYIMAMWKMTELPFHVLDEFEACLDEPSRTSIHATLIEHARENPDAQFIILTPLQLDSRIPKNDPFITVESLEKLDK